MKEMNYLAFVAMLMGLCFITSCNWENSDFTNSTVSQYLYYQTQQGKLHQKGVRVAARLVGTKKTGEVKVMTKVENLSRYKVKLDYYEAQLESLDGIRSGVQDYSRSELALSPGDIVEDTLYFHPINALKLYQKIGYKGDLLMQYGLNLSFIKDSEGNDFMDKTIDFSLSGDDYHDYLVAYSLEKSLKPFNYAFEPELFIKKQEEYLKQLKQRNNEKEVMYAKVPYRTLGSVQVSDQEILINGVNFKAAVFENFGKLYLSLKIVNHGNRPIQFSPEKLIIASKEREYAPLNIESGKRLFESKDSNGSRLILRRGERFMHTFVYELGKETLSTFSLSTKGIQLASHPLFVEDIGFQ